jgi:hypothetical protein
LFQKTIGKQTRNPHFMLSREEQARNEELVEKKLFVPKS